ncbi:MAG: PhzF family phenazine biosynthesis protein [Cytophagales bacterium]|nr:PhzF family phenazine biosynthesis protein [Cytophagales bacterium]
MNIYQVDAFTDKPFCGNPAAVCVLSRPADEGWMQQLAQEMNLSETAFFHPFRDGYKLRWFTPTREVDLCGHATLASAHILWEANYISPNESARFHTRSGLLTARKNREQWIELDFPAMTPEPAELPEGVLSALGVTPLYTGKNGMDYLVEIGSEAELMRVRPDFRKLAEAPARGVIVTSRSDNNAYDFVSRFFAPAAGVDEDPVTGSAHCALTPYWAAKLGKSQLNAFQASYRGGVLKVRTNGDRVILAGKAITVLKGEWLG